MTAVSRGEQSSDSKYPKRDILLYTLSTPALGPEGFAFPLSLMGVGWSIVNSPCL